ncbi:MAG: tetratricopeptide repeat protein [Sphingomicrobium sp.]
MEAQITPICKFLAGGVTLALAFGSAPASARLRASPSDPAWAYVQARTAAMNGDHARAAELLAALYEAMPGQKDFARKALGEAIDSGQFDLALSLTRQVPPQSLAADARLLVIADEMKRRRFDNASAWLVKSTDGSDLSFLKPLIAAWSAADRNDLTTALEAIAAIPPDSPIIGFKNEEMAFLYLRLGRAADAEPYARRAIGTGGIRETRLRLAFASGFLSAGDKANAAAMLDGIAPEAIDARDRLLAGKLTNQAVDNGAKALSEVLTALAGDLVRAQRTTPPLGLAQVARYANPDNSSAAILLALLLDLRGRPDAGLAVLASVPATDPLISQARDNQVRILVDDNHYDQALAIALAGAARPGAASGDFSRLGDVYSGSKRPLEAAEAYGRAIAVAQALGDGNSLWTLYLLRASALKEAGRWPEARQALEQGLTVSPDQPLLLNFLGYARLERGEDMDSAEAMIRKASALAPDDASITDSLGWAQYKRGKVDEAIATLQKAAEKDPDQAEIREHLGDALYASGRRFEARYAWSAALLTAQEDAAGRLGVKIKSGLTPATAAP